MYSKVSFRHIIQKFITKKISKVDSAGLDRLKGKRKEGKIFKGDEGEQRAAWEPQVDQIQKQPATPR